MIYIVFVFLNFVVSLSALRMTVSKPACFTEQKDWQAPLSGSWVQRSPEEMVHPYSEEFGNADDFAQGRVDQEFVKRWEAHACPLEAAHQSCFYHGKNQAKIVQARRFQPDSCDLPDYDAPTLLSKLRGRKIYFIGDSVTVQHFVSFGCHASKFIESTNIEWETDRREGHTNCPFKDQNHCHFVGYHGQHGPPVEQCVHFGGDYKNTSMCFMWAAGRHEDGHDEHWQQTLHKFDSFQAKDIVIMNFGAHFHGESKEDVEQYTRRLKEVAMAAKRWGGYFLWREASPEHFDTHDGLYALYKGGELSKSPCKASPNYNDWRNELANPIMRSEGIDIMYVHENAHSQWDSHVGESYRTDGFVQDCQHWCMPSVPDLWTQVLYNMLTKRDVI